MKKNFDPSLYLVADPEFLSRSASLEKTLEAAIQGGVTIVQIREKNCSNEEFISLARRSKRILDRWGVPLIVNDRVDVALLVDAAGVHVGQSDLHWQEVRRLLGADKIVGLSVESMQDAKNVEKEDIDYLGVSSVFKSGTKHTKKNFGLEGLRELRKESAHVLVGIGGIGVENAASVIEAGADGVAVVSEICSATAPKQITAQLKSVVRKSIKNGSSS